MRDPLPNNETLTKYLLGTLPAAELDYFDELSITDDNFVAALRETENDLIDAHSRNELTGATLARFNSHYLASPLRRERADFGRTFQTWSGDLPGASSPKAPDDTHFAGPSWFSWLEFKPRWAGAAVLAVGIMLIAVAALIVQNRRLQQREAETQARYTELRQREQELQNQVASQRTATLKTEQELARIREERERLDRESNPPAAPVTERVNPVIALVLTVPMRGANQQPTVTIRPGSSTLAAQIELGLADFPLFQAELIDSRNGLILWQRGKINARGADRRKTLSLSVPLHLLRPGNYLIRVTGRPAAAPPELVGDYPFRVVK